jgi:hypothetical protein
MMEQIRDIVEGEPSYYVYASPKEVKAYFSERQVNLINVAKKSKAQQYYQRQKRALKVHQGQHGGARRLAKRKLGKENGCVLGDSDGSSYGISLSRRTLKRNKRDSPITGIDAVGPDDDDADDNGPSLFYSGSLDDTDPWRFFQQKGFLYCRPHPVFVERWKALQLNMGTAVDFNTMIKNLFDASRHHEDWENLHDRLDNKRYLAKDLGSVPELSPFADLVKVGIK